MKINSKRPWMAAGYLSAIFDALNGEVRFVGGCVRDALLDKAVQDIDMATPLLPERVMELLKKARIKAIPTGIEHGTVTAVSKGRAVEITTLRRDEDCDGRHADVTFTDDWEEDAARRDFTINAMNCDAEGMVNDYFGGVEDLKAGHIRFVGDANARCKEDYLRILRFFRFFAHYGKEAPDEAGLTACAANASGIEGLSGERIQKEMVKLLLADAPQEALELMQKAGVLAYILPAEIELSGLDDFLAIEVQLKRQPDWVERLALLLRSVPLEITHIEAVCQRWRLSNKDATRLVLLCFPPYEVTPDVDEWIQKRLIRQSGKEEYEALVMLEWAEAQTDAGDRQLNDMTLAYLPLIELVRQWDIPVFPLKGKDLLAAGFPAGKTLGEQLKKAENYWEQQHYGPSQQQLLDWVKES